MIELVLAALLGTPPAHACGGFFCSAPTDPVDQSGERILFVVDDEAEQIEVHVQIAYEGPASEFSWIVPVPSEPELVASSDAIFQRLGQATDPVFTLNTTTDGTCRSTPQPVSVGCGSGMQFRPDGAVDASDGGDVQISDRGLLGPYAFSVLRARTTDELLTWLDDNAYFVPPGIGPNLEPYVAEHSWFIALRLDKGRDTGELVPLAFRYPGREPTIPLQLTAIAATDGMVLQPFILGPGRAVPDNYLHVRLNPFAIDWRRRGRDYLNVIARAADEAGGQAFATDFAGPAAAFIDVLWDPRGYDPRAARFATRSSEIPRALQEARIPFDESVLPSLLEAAPLPPRLEPGCDEPLTAYAEPACLDADWPVNGPLLARLLDENWVQPLRHVTDLFERHGVLTRLSSSMDPGEMTVDPRFIFREDLPPVSNEWTATMETWCGDRKATRRKAPRRLIVPDGRFMWLPAEYATTTTFDYLGFLGEMGQWAAERIDQIGRSGEPVPIVDRQADIDDWLATNHASAVAPGCGGGEVPAGAWLLGLGLLGALRRRTATANRLDS